MSSLALVSLLLAPTPWLFPSVVGVAVGLAAHLAWFITCELLVGARLVPAVAGAPRIASAIPAPAPVLPAPAPVPVTPAAAPAAPAPSAASARGFIQVPILSTFDETADMKTIRCVRPDDFDFEAGQFVTVRVRVDGKDLVRCYSISSAPEVRGYFEVTVKRQGVVSNQLHATSRAGAMLAIRRPNGKFVYPGGDDRPIVLLAGGVGVTPLMSMLRHAVATEPTRPVTLVYSAQTAAHFAFADELRTIALRHPQVRVLRLATRDTAPPPNVRIARVDEELLREAIPDLVHSLAYICGPKPMIDDTKAMLIRMGVPAPQVRHEVFEAAIAASSAPIENRPTAPVRPQPAARSAQAFALRADAAPALASGLPMRCVTAGKTITVQPGETLLEAAERGGVPISSLCRAGVCGTCRMRVTEGDVHCDSTTLDASERAAGFVLACIATARSACAVEL